MNDTEATLMGRVAELRGKLVAWTAELVAIPTVNPYSGDASAGSEAAGQEWIAERFRQLGGAVNRVPVPPDVYAQGGVIGPPDRSWQGRENVVAEWTLGSGSGPRILLNDHMDTVGTEGMEFDPFDPVIRGSKMFGRGTSDTKGNLIMGLMAVEALLAQEGDLNGKIIFESVVDEECSGGGAGTLACCLAGVTGDFAICLDGAKGALDNGCNGITTARVRVKGRAGHAALGQAVNAIDKGVAVKQAIDAFGEEHRKAFPTCHTNIGVFRAGTHPAIVPDEAELHINMPYALEDAAQAEAQTGHCDGRLFRARFEQAMERLAETDSWFAEEPADVFWIKDLYPFLSDASDHFIQLAATAVAEVEGAPVPVAPMPAWFDAAHLARQLNIPALGMGGGAPGCAHSSGEYVVLDDLVAAAKSLALTLCRFLKKK